MTWYDEAACRGMDPGMFVPTHEGTAPAAKKVCGSCPVAGDCLTAGQGQLGIWGGLTSKQRGVRLPPLRGVPRISHGTEGGARAHYRRGESPCPSCADAALHAARDRRAGVAVRANS